MSLFFLKNKKEGKREQEKERNNKKAFYGIINHDL